MKVKNLIIELKEMHPDDDVVLVEDRTAYTRIVSRNEHVLIKGTGGDSWKKALEAWPDRAS